MSAQTERDVGRGRFVDSVAVVTGAGAGLGRSIAEAILEEGGLAVLVDRDSDRLSWAESHAPERVGTARCDVTVRDEVRATVDEVIRRWGRVDILVNNAGVSSVAPVAELTEHQWDECFDVNVKGVFLCSQAVLPPMLARGSGSIVNVASQEGRRGTPFIAHYCAAKAAVINLTRALAREVAPAVRVNAVCPGVIETEMVEQTLERLASLRGTSEEQLREDWLSSIPLGRFQQPADIARSVLFLASDEASEITGEALNVSGGSVMD